MIKDIIISEMCFTLWNVARVCIYRWNGLLPRMQSLVYNSTLIISSLREMIFEGKYLISDLYLIQTQLIFEMIHSVCFADILMRDQHSQL